MHFQTRLHLQLLQITLICLASKEGLPESITIYHLKTTVTQHLGRRERLEHPVQVGPAVRLVPAGLPGHREARGVQGHLEPAGRQAQVEQTAPTEHLEVVVQVEPAVHQEQVDRAVPLEQMGLKD